MTKKQIKHQIKATALNKIRRIYHPQSKWEPSKFSERSSMEQKGWEVKYIMENMEQQLEELDLKFKKKEAS